MSFQKQDRDDKGSDSTGWAALGIAAIGVGIGVGLAYLFSGSSKLPHCSRATNGAGASTKRSNKKYRRRKAGCVTCSVCIEDIASIVTLPCGHRFHDKCVRRWVQGLESCPNCRRPTTLDQLKCSS
ncbi:unnamed protein product, partial [Iphiclides podalirius]